MTEIDPNRSRESVTPIQPLETHKTDHSLSQKKTSESVTSPNQVTLPTLKRYKAVIGQLKGKIGERLPSVKQQAARSQATVAFDLKGQIISTGLSPKKFQTLESTFIKGLKVLEARYPHAAKIAAALAKAKGTFDSLNKLLNDQFKGDIEILTKDTKELYEVAYHYTKPPVKALIKLLRDPDELEGKFLTSPLPPSFVAATEVLGKILAIGTGIGVILDLVGIASATLQIGTGVGKISGGLRHIKESKLAKPEFVAAKIKYGKEKVSDGVRLIGTGGAWLGASIASLARGAASLAIHIQPAVTAGASVAVAAGGLILAPIALTLSSIGIAKNIRHLRRAHGRLLVVRSEIERTRGELKLLLHKKLKGTISEEELQKYEELTERNEFLTFAERRLKTQKVKEILGIVQNSFVIVASISGALSLVSGQAGAAFFAISLISFGLGIGGNLIGRGVLAAVNKYQKEESIKKYEEGDEIDRIDNPRYLSNKEAFNRYAEKFHNDVLNKVEYTGSGNPADWSNNELALQILNPHEGFKAEVEKDDNGNLSVKYTAKDETLKEYSKTKLTQQEIFAAETKKFATKVAYESHEKKLEKQVRLKNEGASQEKIDKVKPDKKSWKKAFGS